MQRNLKMLRLLLKRLRKYLKQLNPINVQKHIALWITLTEYGIFVDNK